MGTYVRALFAHANCSRTATQSGYQKKQYHISWVEVLKRNNWIRLFVFFLECPSKLDPRILWTCIRFAENGSGQYNYDSKFIDYGTVWLAIAVFLQNKWFDWHWLWARVLFLGPFRGYLITKRCSFEKNIKTISFV